MRPSWYEQVERIFDRMGVCQQQSSLAEIVEHQRRRHDREPSELDGQPAKMAHIGIHGFGARERQEGGAEHGEGDAGSCVTEVENGVMGAYGGENGGALHDALEAEHADRNEPNEHRRPEDPADELRSLALDQEQTDKDRDSDRND